MERGSFLGAGAQLRGPSDTGCEVFTLLFILQPKEEMSVGHMESTGDRVGRWEKAKWGNLCDWIKGKMDRHTLLLHWWS